MLIIIMSILSIMALSEELLINKHYLSVHLLQIDPFKWRMEEMQQDYMDLGLVFG